jgi:hypothetical protein
VEKSLIAFAPYNPRHASGSNLGALAIIMNFSTLVYNILFLTKKMDFLSMIFIIFFCETIFNCHHAILQFFFWACRRKDILFIPGVRVKGFRMQIRPLQNFKLESTLKSD